MINFTTKAMRTNIFITRLSELSGVSESFIENIEQISVFSAEDLYDFYRTLHRFPTVEEMDAAFATGIKEIYSTIKTTRQL